MPYRLQGGFALELANPNHDDLGRFAAGASVAAKEHGGKADRASARAEKSASKGDYTAAHQAHAKASEKHGAAKEAHAVALKSAKARGNKTDIKFHKDSMKYHEKAQVDHAQKGSIQKMKAGRESGATRNAKAPRPSNNGLNDLANMYRKAGRNDKRYQ